MGCDCKNVQRPEEDTILSFFNHKLKEQKFDFTIKSYKENYDLIAKKSGNNFKRLCKKEVIRMKFVKLLRKEEKNLIENNEIKEGDIKKILYYIIISTLLIDKKMDEYPENDIAIESIYEDIKQYNLISLKRELLEFGYDLIIIKFTDVNNEKIIIYYISRLFCLCFTNFFDANNYIFIKAFIEKIKIIIDNNNFIDEEEKYIFTKDNLLTLGEYFHYNNNTFFDETVHDLMIRLSAMTLNYCHDFFINNLHLIKDTINKNVRNAYCKIMNYNEYNNYIENNNQNNNIKLEIIKSDNINNDIIYKDIKSIFESLYYILKEIIQDIFSGKNTIIALGNQLIEKNNENYQFNNIIMFIIFYACCIKDDEKLILCFMEYITYLCMNKEQIIIKDNNNIFNDIALNSYYFVYKNEQISKQYISLLTQIFIMEMEMENFDNNQILLSKLIQIYQKKENNKMNKLFFYFILHISRHYKDMINSNNNNKNIINNDNKFNDIIKNIFFNLNNLIKTYFINNINGVPSSIKEKGVMINTNNYYNLSTNNATSNIYNNDSNTNILKIPLTIYDIIITNIFGFNDIKNELIDIIEFYIYFHSFIINNMNISLLINDFTKREKIYCNLFKIITKIENIIIQESFEKNNLINTDKNENNKQINYINDIISSIQIILKINELNDSTNNIQDCYIFYKSLEKNIQTFLELKISNNFSIESLHLKIIYSIIFFILSQFIRLINIPNSITKHNTDIINTIKQSQEKIGNFLSSINISNFIVLNNLSDNQNYNYLKELFSSENNENFEINVDIFKQIMDIIYSKLYGKNTSLNIFFDNQILNSKYFYNVNNSFDKTLSKLDDNITEVKENSVINQYKDNLEENFIEDISINMLEQKKKVNSINDINNNTFIKSKSNIKVPSEDENIISNDILLTNNYTNDDNQFQNIKI